MPYIDHNDPKLPDNVRERTSAERRRFVGAFNNSYAQCRADGGSGKDCESRAFAIATAAMDNDTKAAKFRRYTYNGVSVQATGRRPSSRDDKKYERTVMVNGRERLVHYGDPNLPMQRDVPERRENFLARHNCSAKKDPSKPGFWACLDWQRTDEKSMSNSLKTIKRTDDELVVGNYIILFGDEKQRDLDSEYFTKSTDVTSPHTQIGRFPVDWEHGLIKSDGPDGALGFVDWNTAKVDEKGIFVNRVLDRRNKYIQMLDDAGFFEDGLIGSSSEANPRSVQKSNGHILRWPLIGDALTVNPAEPRMLKENQISVIKSIGLEMDMPETAQDTVSATIEPVYENSTLDIIMENEIMSEDTNLQELVTDAVKASFADLAGTIRETVKEEVKAHQPLKTGISVVEDEVDKELRERPFKSFGEFLLAVARGNDNRLPATKSDVPGMERGYFDVSKAIKAPTGLGELIPANGGFLVGTDQMGGVLQRDYNTGELLRRVDTVTVSGNANSMTFNAIDETSRANGSRQGGIRAYWTAEASTKTASNPTFRQMRLTLQKVAALVYATDELLQDSMALETWINNNLPDEIRFVVEDAIMNGTGSGMPLGILAAGNNSLVSVAAEAGQAAGTLLAENVVKIWGRRWVGRGSNNYAWFVNQDVEQQLHQMSLPVGTGGALVYMPPGGLSQSPYGTLYGRPVIVTEYNPTLGTAGDILLADMSQYQAIDKGGIMGASSIHVRFINDETTFRFVYRYDGQPKWDSALTPFNGTNTVSPFVTVATRS